MPYVLDVFFYLNIKYRYFYSIIQISMYNIIFYWMVYLHCSIHFPGDTDSAATYRKAYLKGQGNMDVYQWNQTSHYYNAYTMVSSSEEYRPMRYVQTKRGWTKLPGRGQPATPGAIMTDSFYAQVRISQQHLHRQHQHTCCYHPPSLSSL